MSSKGSQHRQRCLKMLSFKVSQIADRVTEIEQTTLNFPSQLFLPSSRIQPLCAPDFEIDIHVHCICSLSNILSNLKATTSFTTLYLWMNLFRLLSVQSIRQLPPTTSDFYRLLWTFTGNTPALGFQWEFKGSPNSGYLLLVGWPASGSSQVAMKLCLTWSNQHFFRGGQKITSGTWSILRYWWFVSSFQRGQGSRLTGLGPFSFGIEIGNSGEVGSLSGQNYIGWTANILTRGWQSWPRDCSSLGRSPSPWAWGWRRWWRRGRWARPRGSPLEGLEASHWGRESSRGWNCHNAQKNSSRSRRCQGHGTSWTRRSMPWWRTFPPSEDKKVKSYKFTVFGKKYWDLYYIDKNIWNILHWQVHQSSCPNHPARCWWRIWHKKTFK